MAAPGDSILTYLRGARTLSGTSMASPLAAGIAAMLKKQASNATPGDLRKATRKKVDSRRRSTTRWPTTAGSTCAEALAAIKSIVQG